MQTIALSESAVAVLRFRVKGWHFPIRDRDRDAFRELIAAGIMAPVTGADGTPEVDYRFTEDGWVRRHELLHEAEERIERERYGPPVASNLSEEARELLRTCIAGKCPDGDETNRPAYRELVKARIMIPVGSFIKGDECVFHFTYWSIGAAPSPHARSGQ